MTSFTISCILALTYAFFKTSTADSVEYIYLNATTCTESNVTNPVYINEFHSFEVAWNGSSLPEQCMLVYRGSDYKGRTNNYQLCVKPSAYNVTDCDFQLLFSDEGSGKSKSNSCGTEVSEFCTEMDNSLNIQFFTTNVTDHSRVTLIVSAERYEALRPEIIGAIVGGIIGFVTIIALCVFFCCFRIRKRQEEETQDEKVLEPLKEDEKVQE